MNNFTESIIAKKTNDLFALKGNRRTLHKEATDHFHIALRHLKLEKWLVTKSLIRESFDDNFITPPEVAAV